MITVKSVLRFNEPPIPALARCIAVLMEANDVTIGRNGHDTQEQRLTVRRPAGLSCEETNPCRL